jgi:2-phosphosulfolactate phosphatase
MRREFARAGVRPEELPLIRVPRVPTVQISAFPETAPLHRDGAVVGVDVIRATTTAVTAAAAGRRVFLVPSLELAVPLAARLEDPLLVGELGGNMPYGFHLQNSPAQIARRDDVERPMILLSTSGTRLLCDAQGAEAVYPGCLRNVSALARHLARTHDRVAVIGAGTRGEFREEDQYGSALIAAALIDQGFDPDDTRTRELVQRWRDQPVDAIRVSNSVKYLEDSGQMEDLEFVLSHVDDVDAVFMLNDGELVAA